MQFGQADALVAEVNPSGLRPSPLRGEMLWFARFEGVWVVSLKTTPAAGAARPP